MLSFHRNSSSFDDPPPDRKIQNSVPDFVSVEDDEVRLFTDRDTVAIGNAEHACSSLGAHFQNIALIVWRSELRNVRKQQTDLQRIRCTKGCKRVTDVV